MKKPAPRAGFFVPGGSGSHCRAGRRVWHHMPMSGAVFPNNPFRLSRRLGAVACVLATLVVPAHATDVALAGVFPGKALLVINGGRTACGAGRSRHAGRCAGRVVWTRKVQSLISMGSVTGCLSASTR